MKRIILAVLVIAMVGSTAFYNQAAEQAPAKPAKSSPAKTTKASLPRGRPFRGKIKTISQTVPGTIVLEGPAAQTFLLTSETRITKDNQRATLRDLKPGDAVTGYIRETPDGKWEARTIYTGQRAPKTK